jgi:hypothetical protein
VFGVEVAGREDRQSAAETGDQFPSDQWAGRRKVNRKDLHRSAAQCDLSRRSLQVGQARDGH